MEKWLEEQVNEHFKAKIAEALERKRHSDITEGCHHLYDWFKGLTEAGFNETQALTIIVSIIKNN